MTRFDTPRPVTAIVEIGTGHILVRAGDRTDTVVDVRPSNGSDDADARAADEAQVDYSQGRLTVRMPRARQKLRSLFGRMPSVEVTIDLPTGSELEVHAWGEVRSEGRLGATDVHTAAGAIDLDETAQVKARTAAGNVSVGLAAGNADLTTAAGNIRLGAADGTVKVTTSAGNIVVGDIVRGLKLHTSNGDISVDRAVEGLHARTSYGGIQVGEVVRDDVDLVTAFGEIEVGVRSGTAAWLDAGSGYGDVHSELTASDEPGPTTDKVKVRARTSFGDITIRRVPAPSDAPAEAPVGADPSAAVDAVDGTV
jgi:DUF4097 and DUF4098 domain-containing protein YvlB